MKKVFIPINTKIPVLKQFPTKETVWGNYEFVIGEKCENYDILVVLDDLPGAIITHCSKNNSVLFTGEPPTVKKYPSKYLSQFGHIFSCQKQLLKNGKAKLSIPPLPWMLVYDFNMVSDGRYNDFDFFNDNVTKTERLDKICLLTSNKRFSKGHCERIRFAEKIKIMMPDLIDIYGLGYDKMDVKYDVLSRYKYTIVIENSSYDDYWTEKIADAFLAGCYPVYYGPKNIYDFFTKEEMTTIDIHNIDQSIESIKNVIKEDLYGKYVKNITTTRNKVLYNYNMFSIISTALDKISYDKSNNIRTISPLVFPIHYLLQKKIRLFWYQNIYR